MCCLDKKKELVHSNICVRVCLCAGRKMGSPPSIHVKSRDYVVTRMKFYTSDKAFLKKKEERKTNNCYDEDSRDELIVSNTSASVCMMNDLTRVSVSCVVDSVPLLVY